MCRGKRVDGTVQCPYHGWRYDGSGKCVEIPSLGDKRHIPKRARVDAYPARDQWGWIWVFLGDLPEEERPPLPDFFPEYEQQDGSWQFVRGRAHFDCNWVRAIENGVDATHAVFVHTDFGNPETLVKGDYEVLDEDNRLYSAGKGKPINKRGAWREVLPDERGERETEVQIFVPAPCIRIQMHMHPPISQIIVTAYTPIDEGRTQLNFIHSRNFMMDPEHDKDALRRVHLVIDEDAAVLNHLQPARVPPSLADELLLVNDKHGTMFRKKIKALEAQGRSIDSRVLSDQGDYARVIPSPARGADPKNWVLKPVPLKAAPSKSEG